MSKTTYVWRGGQVIEKPKARPMIEMLPMSSLFEPGSFVEYHKQMIAAFQLPPPTPPPSSVMMWNLEARLRQQLRDFEAEALKIVGN